MMLSSSRSPSHLGRSSPSPSTPSRASPTRFGWSSPSPLAGLDDSGLLSTRNAFVTSAIDSRASTPSKGSRSASLGVRSAPQTPSSKGALPGDRARSLVQGKGESRPGSAPQSHAQRVAELHYDQFCMRRLQNHRSESSTSEPAPSRRRKKLFDASCPWAQLPPSLRPAAFEVEMEMRQTGRELNEALAALVVGRNHASTLATLAKADSPASHEVKRSVKPSSTTPTSRECGYSSPTSDLNDLHTLMPAMMRPGSTVLNVKACLDLASNGAFEMERPQPSRIVAAAALLQGTEGMAQISTVQMEDVGLQEAPDTLHLLSSLSSISLSGNTILQNVAALKKCNDIRSLDLSGCSTLRDIQVLGLLPFLEVADLSFCSNIEDVTPLLVSAQMDGLVGAVNVDLSNLSRAASPAKSVRRFRAQISEQNHDRVASQGRKKQLGHPSLRWLSMTGCTSLKRGILHLNSCDALVYVDLYGCLDVDLSECFIASQAVALRGTFIWPSRSILAKSVLAQNSSQSQQNAILAAAANAIAEKLAVARGRRPVPAGTHGLPSLTGTAKSDAMKSAISAASDMGIFTSADQAKWDAGGSQEETRANASIAGGERTYHLRSCDARDAGGSKPRLGSAQPRLGPVDFARAVHAVGFEDPNGVDICDMFKILDEDNDGGLTIDELCKLEYGPPAQADSDAAIECLLKRKRGSVEAVAADLAGNREEVDKFRLEECLIVSGIEEASARRIANALAHSCCGIPEGDENAEELLLNALYGYVVARSIALMKDFREHLHSRFTRCEDAYWVFSESRQGSVSWDEFQRRILDPIKWPAANTAGAVDNLFRALDMEGSGSISLSAFQLLEVFQPDKTLRAILHAGRSISRGLAGGAPAEFRLGDPLDEKSFTRSEFVNAWDGLGEPCQEVDARWVFGLLDIHGNNLLSNRELFVLSAALVRRTEAAALGCLGDLLSKRFGSLREMHNLLLHKDAYVALPVVSADANVEKRTSKTRRGSRPSANSFRG